MSPIPRKLRRELNLDSYYKKCAITENRPVKWHHVYIYAGRQIQERWNIIPLYGPIHDAVKKNIAVKQRCQWMAINRTSITLLKLKYPKFDWMAEKIRLNTIFKGAYREPGTNR